jgi:hypothetical protein
VPSFDSIEPLAPDACRSDPSAPCLYWHLKLRALNGERDRLPQRDLEFVGVGVSRRRDTWDGWHQPGEIEVLWASDGVEEAATFDPVLWALTRVGQSRLEFLGS